MKKIYQYILLVVAMVATASCSNELDDTLQPVENGTLQFVVGDFPAFGEDPQTRASSLGTPDAGKTAWEEGDEIFVTLISAHFGTQHAVLTYGGITWTLAGELNYLADESVENGKLDIIATYAPYYELKDGELSLTDEYALGKGEYLEVKCYIIEGVLNVSFEEAIRNYSRIRIVCSDGVEELSVRALYFIPAGHERQSICEIQHVPVDDNGNAFIYGTFEEDGSIEVEDWDIEGAKLAVHGFTETTMSDKSYALDARAISIDGSLGGKAEVTMEEIEELARFFESSVNEGKTTFILTGESQAMYDIYTYVGYALAEVAWGDYGGTINFTYGNVTEIIEYELAACKSLKTLKLPYVTSCAPKAFYDCTNLEKIIFGSVVTFVGEDAFKDVDNYVDGGCELVLNKEQVNVEGLSPDLTNKTWAGHTWKSITLK